MYLLRFLLLWIILTVCFCLFNSSFEKYAILIQATNSLLFTSGFYFSYEFLIKRLLYKGKVAQFIVSYLLAIVCLSIISLVLVYQIYILQENKFYVENYWKEPVFLTSNLLLILLVTSTLLSFRFFRDKMETQLLFENLEKEKISTELSFLKAQINPHFLFNSLNSILFQIDKSNKDARDTLLKFSEMLRYQLYECNDNEIEIEKEIRYLRNYIGIQLLRKSKQYNCEVTISDSVKNFKIAPLMLIPFIENAFKYVSHHTDRINHISITMDYHKNEFHFNCTNDREQKIAEQVIENKGIGLLNLKRRLQLLYENRHELIIAENDYEFSISLKVNILQT
ncbi:histidine kinase [soil metagenome]